MKPVVVKLAIVVLAMTPLSYSVHAADVLRDDERWQVKTRLEPQSGPQITISGRAAIIDGRTLWFPKGEHRVRLASIDACELPQWSYDPRHHGESRIPKPVPCGPLAKAWLKRTVGNAVVNCLGHAYDTDGAVLGRCAVKGRDLALEMLRVGWARAKSPAPDEYLSWQNYAMSARHGMWATYVLDMPEWRAKAVDRTLSRRPIADFNLLAERESEISPPFDDARKRPGRTDR